MATDYRGVVSYADGMADIVDELMADMVQGIRHNARMAGKNVTGATLRSLHYAVQTETDGGAEATLWARKFFSTLETGRGPARKKGSDADRARWQAAMKEWCRMRGFPQSGLEDEAYERAARFLRWYINRNGDALWRKGGRKDIFTPEIANFKARLRERLMALSRATITETLYGRKSQTEVVL